MSKLEIYLNSFLIYLFKGIWTKEGKINGLDYYKKEAYNHSYFISGSNSSWVLGTIAGEPGGFLFGWDHYDTKERI